MGNLSFKFGAEFCPRTGFVSLPYEVGSHAALMQRPDFIHETFHYLSSFTTDAGLFLSCLRYARARRVRAYLNYVNPEYVTGQAYDAEASRLLFNRQGFKLADVLDIENEHVPAHEFEILKLKMSELVFLKYSKVHSLLEGQKIDPSVLLIEGAIATAKEVFHKYKMASPWEHAMDEIVLKMVGRLSEGMSFPFSAEAGRYIDTLDIFEAYSVLADLRLRTH